MQVIITLRLSVQSESSVSETELRLPSACVLLFIMCIRQKRATIMHILNNNVSYFAYTCKTEGKNGISRLISGLCVNCLSSIPEYSRLNHLDVYLV